MTGSADSKRQNYDVAIRLLFEQVKHDRDSDDALQKLNEIANLATTALEQAGDQSIENDIFHSYRGRAFLGRYNHRKRKDRTDLDQAITEFELASSTNPDARSYVQALLAKSYLLKNKEPAEALRVLSKAKNVASAIPAKFSREKAEQQIELNSADCSLRIAIRTSDVTEMVKNSRRILGSAGNSMFLFPLAYAAKAMLKESNSAEIRQLAIEIGAKLDDTSQNESLEKKLVAEFSSHAASIFLALGSEFIESALNQNLRVVAADPAFATAFRCSIIGRLALDVGKNYLRTGDVNSGTNHFRDAIEWLRKSIEIADGPVGENNPMYDIVVTYCCLGESYLRLQSIVGGANLGRRALRNFETALRIGTPPPETISLMADAHFRIGRYLRDEQHLRSAIALKKETLESYKPTREAWSICSAAQLLLFELTNDHNCLSEAIEACIRAHEVDVSWPWPFLQLSGILTSNGVHSQNLESIRLRILPAAIGTVDIETRLKERAVDLTIENTEFEREVIGGRTKVFVLSDQHKLLSSSIVLKPTTPQRAIREKEAAIDFGRYLRQLPGADQWQLPQPISIKRVQSDKCIYAMERAEGETLADRLIDLVSEKKHDEIEQLFQQAIKFLGAYHSWRDGHLATRQGRAIKEVNEITTILECDTVVVKGLEDAVKRCLPENMRLVAKKDAHPENWLVTPLGIVMLDLESTGVRPLGYEIAQLVDDYGILDVSPEGWRVRLTLMRTYLDILDGHGLPIATNDIDIEASYAVFWALRCGFGIGYCRRNKAAQSSTVRNRLSERTLHYVKSLRFLEQVSTDVGAVANIIRSAAKISD